MIRFGLIGGGWRSEFYIRISAALPELFTLTGVYLRNPDTMRRFEKKYPHIPLFGSLSPLLDTKPDFLVLAVSKAEGSEEIIRLADMGLALLAETPAGNTVEATEALLAAEKPFWRVQVAEQFHLMPRFRAIKSIIDEGKIGEVTHVTLSCCHDYHAVSLLRYLLDATGLPEVSGITLTDRLTRHSGRYGDIPPEEAECERKTALLHWGGKTAFYDFSKEQYFSLIRRKSIIVQGVKGEITEEACTYIEGDKPTTLTLSPLPHFKNATLDEDEQAIALCLIKMDEYLKTGKEFYPLKRACQDALIAYRLGGK
ncbi:MAG: Gfo/Idh/MocA family oxidoreductase [Clostridia bacterium]|nr:Gfo/Idh/MocA family oxidoreductase [Clostridia bacterium]